MFGKSRKKKPGRYVTFMIIPHEDAPAHSLRVSRNSIVAAITLLVVFLLVIVVFMVFYGKILLQAQKATILERRVNDLAVHREEIASLKSQLREMEEMSVRLRQMLGMPLSPVDSLYVGESGQVLVKNTTQETPSKKNLDVADQEEVVLLRSLPSQWPTKGWISRGFHIAEGEGSPRYHPGIDIAASRGAPVVVAADGIIITSAWNETYGHYIEVDHGFGTNTLYGHNERNVVSEGDRVRRGQVIAFLGSSGRSTAPHLHFEITKNGVPVDPMGYLLSP